MKRTILVLCVLASALACSKFDDTKLWEAIKSNTERIVSLEKICAQMNEDIKNLQTIVSALQGKDYVTNVSPLADGTGYTISFSKSGSIVIKNGTDGKNGKDGENGKDGKAPVISVALGSDGIYYWTLDGQFITDAYGNKIQAQGINGKNGENGKDGEGGKDGITPKFKIVDGYWYISYDNEKTWEKLGKASGDNGLNGDDGDSFFKGVSIESGYVKFTLNDGKDTVIKLAYITEVKEKVVELTENHRLPEFVSSREASGINKLICTGVINKSDLDYIYDCFYNATEIDLSGCEYDSGVYDMLISNECIKNPFQERFLENLRLPHNLLVFSSIYPNLKRVEFQDSKGGTSYDTYNFTLNQPKYYLYSYSGTEQKVQNRFYDRVTLAEGSTELYGPISKNGGDPTCCDTLVLPNTITRVRNDVFYSSWNMGFTNKLICLAQTPPSIYINSAIGTKEVFYLRGYYDYSKSKQVYVTENIPSERCVLFVPESSIEAYKSAPGWSQFEDIRSIE